jgi:hypothetical protein
VNEPNDRPARPLSAAEFELPRTAKPAMPSRYVEDRLAELRRQGEADDDFDSEVCTCFTTNSKATAEKIADALNVQGAPPRLRPVEQGWRGPALFVRRCTAGR